MLGLGKGIETSVEIPWADNPASLRELHKSLRGKPKFLEPPRARVLFRELHEPPRRSGKRPELREAFLLADEGISVVSAASWFSRSNLMRGHGIKSVSDGAQVIVRAATEGEPKELYSILIMDMLWINERRKPREAWGTKTSDTTDLPHYSRIVSSVSFSIWLTKSNAKKYSAEQMDIGSFNRGEGVEKYVVWWNAIRKWGLGPNARSFKRDLELLWKKVDSVDLKLTPPLTVER